LNIGHAYVGGGERLTIHASSGLLARNFPATQYTRLSEERFYQVKTGDKNALTITDIGVN